MIEKTVPFTFFKAASNAWRCESPQHGGGSEKGGSIHRQLVMRERGRAQQQGIIDRQLLLLRRGHPFTSL